MPVKTCYAICHVCIVYILLVLSTQRLYLAPSGIWSELYSTGFCKCSLILLFILSNFKFWILAGFGKTLHYCKLDKRS